MRTSGDGKKKERRLQVSLPGDLYERAGRWWWRTKLPGENRLKARLLKVSQTDDVVRNRETAEKVAVEMWEQAIRENGTQQITRDCAEKIERLKAQFLDKVRQLAEIVDSANTKAQAETHARAEIEARLSAMIQAESRKATAASPVQTQNQTAPPSCEQATLLDVKPTVAEPAMVGGNAEIEVPTRHGPVDTMGPARHHTSFVEENLDLHPPTGMCECCGTLEILVADLHAIDSGQLLCPDCIRALHVDVSRIETDAFSGSRA